MPTGINSNMQSTFSPPVGVTYNFQPLGRAHSFGGGYGAFVGRNSQWEDVVIGVEANYIHSGLAAGSSSLGYTYNPDLSVRSTAYSSAVLKVTDFGSVRLRAGYIMGCFLPYGFVGAGLGGQTVQRAASVSPPPLLPGWTADTKTNLVYGYSAGAGVDIMLMGGLFTRVEYEYQRVTSNIESNINTVRVGLGYKF